MSGCRSSEKVVIVVHPRRQLDDFLSSAVRSGLRVVVVPRPDEASAWEVNQPATVIGVEPWSGSAQDPRFVTFLARVIASYSACGILGLHEPSLGSVSEAAVRSGLPGLDPIVVARLRDKSATRETLAMHGLPAPKYVSGSVDRALLVAAKRLHFPVVVKPVGGFASAGVQRVDQHAGLDDASDRAVAAMQDLGVSSREVIIEEYVDGPEYAVEAISFGARTRILSIGYKGRPEGPYFEESIYEVPSGLTVEEEQRMRLVVERAHRALRIDDGPTHTELRLGADGTPFVLEIGARVGGSGVSHVMVSAATSIDFFADALAVAVGNEPESIRRRASGYAQAAGNFIVQCRGSGVIRAIEGLDQAAAHPSTSGVIQMMHPGDAVRPYPDFSGYPAFILSAHANREELQKFHKQLDRNVRVVYE